MLRDKIKALITMTGHTQSEIAAKKNISRQQFNLKISRNAFRIDDLIELGEYTETKLAFINDKGEVLIKFDRDDIAKKSDQ